MPPAELVAGERGCRHTFLDVRTARRSGAAPTEAFVRRGMPFPRARNSGVPEAHRPARTAAGMAPSRSLLDLLVRSPEPFFEVIYAVFDRRHPNARRPSTTVLQLSVSPLDLVKPRSRTAHLGSEAVDASFNLIQSILGSACPGVGLYLRGADSLIDSTKRALDRVEPSLQGIGPCVDQTERAFNRIETNLDASRRASLRSTRFKRRHGAMAMTARIRSRLRPLTIAAVSIRGVRAIARHTLIRRALRPRPRRRLHLRSLRPASSCSTTTCSPGRTTWTGKDNRDVTVNADLGLECADLLDGLGQVDSTLVDLETLVG